MTEIGSTQRVTWDRDEQLYFNPGPARIPYHHEGILAYCRALGVNLEVLCNDNRGALMQDDRAFDGAPQLNRRVVNDARGYVAELAAKAVDKDLLAQPVSVEDKERLRAFLRGFGALDKDLAYHGSSRAGWATPPDATQPGTSASTVGSAADPGLGFLARADAVRRIVDHGGDHAATGWRHGAHRPGLRARPA